MHDSVDDFKCDPGEKHSEAHRLQLVAIPRSSKSPANRFPLGNYQFRIRNRILQVQWLNVNIIYSSLAWLFAFMVDFLLEK